MEERLGETGCVCVCVCVCVCMYIYIHFTVVMWISGSCCRVNGLNASNASPINTLT